MSKRLYFLSLVFGLLLFGIRVSANLQSYQMPFYTGSILPTPQKVIYYDKFIPLSNTGILLGEGVKNEDLRVKLLVERINNSGGKVKIISSFSEKYQTIISLGKNRLERSLLKKVKLPDKKEGYIIYPAKKGKKNIIILKGKDKLGLLWAIVSFNQLITKKKNVPVVRKVEVYDFPSTEGRGFYMGGKTGSDMAYFAVYFKFNRLVFHQGAITKKVGRPNYLTAIFYDERKEPCKEWKEELKRIGNFLTPLGIEWYVGLSPIRGKPKDKIKSKDEKDFDYIFRIFSLIAESGGNVFLFYDDTRFPISPEDERDFGTAREADIYFINKLYSALKKKYPKVKLEFCPPFYWGPNAPAKYPESRDEYLTAIGKRLPKDIGITWTGPNVSSTKVTKEQVEWITNIIQRKPCFWQNGAGVPHMFGYHYVTDPVPCWKDWYYDGFFNDVRSYGFNVGGASLLATLSDCLWNPKAYDAKRSVEDAAKKLCGVETYPALLELNQKLSYFDKYGLRVSPGAAKDIVEIRKKVAELEKTWKKCLSFYPEAVKKWTSLGWYVGHQKRFLSRLESNPELSAFTKQAEEIKELAKKEVNFDPLCDILLSPHDFSGGIPAKLYSYRCERRLATWIYGAKTAYSKMSAGFDLPSPPTTNYFLIISGQDDDSPKKCKIRITINNNKVFEGENPFISFGWSKHTFPIKAYFLKEGHNVISIENIEDSYINTGPPFFMLNYAIIKKSE